jgi:hypothetical protein
MIAVVFLRYIGFFSLCFRRSFPRFWAISKGPSWSPISCLTPIMPLSSLFVGKTCEVNARHISRKTSGPRVTVPVLLPASEQTYSAQGCHPCFTNAVISQVECLQLWHVLQTACDGYSPTNVVASWYSGRVSLDVVRPSGCLRWPWPPRHQYRCHSGRLSAEGADPLGWQQCPVHLPIRFCSPRV